MPILFLGFDEVKKVKCSRYRPGVAQRVGRGIALLFHDRGTRRGWVVSSTARPNFTPGKDSVPILQEAGWAPGPVWTGGKSCPHRDSIPDRPARSLSLYRMSYRAHTLLTYRLKISARASNTRNEGFLIAHFSAVNSRQSTSSQAKNWTYIPNHYSSTVVSNGKLSGERQRN